MQSVNSWLDLPCNKMQDLNDGACVWDVCRLTQGLFDFQWRCVGDIKWEPLEESIKPALKELGISTLAEMNYDKPEFYFPESEDVHDYDEKGTNTRRLVF